MESLGARQSRGSLELWTGSFIAAGWVKLRPMPTATAVCSMSCILGLALEFNLE